MGCLKLDEYIDYDFNWVSQGSKMYGYADPNGWGDLLTHYDGQAITYDGAGNPTSYRGATLGWQNGRELATYSASGINASYEYDFAGIRTSKTVNGIKTNYYLEGSRIWVSQTNGMMTWYYYDANGIQGMWIQGLGEFYLEKNILGDVIGVYTSGGSYVGGYTYDAWGNILSQTNHPAVNANPFRYRSYFYDTETGLYYLQSRYYDPSTHRFINADEPSLLYMNAGVVGGANLFAYCNNNPVVYTDSTGQFPFLIFAIFVLAVGLTAGVTVGAVSAYNDGLTGWDFAQRVITGAAIGIAIAGAALVLRGVAIGGIGGALGASTAFMTGLKTVYAVGMLAMAGGLATAFVANGIPFQWDGARIIKDINHPTFKQGGGNKALDLLPFYNLGLKQRRTGVQMLYGC